MRNSLRLLGSSLLCLVVATSGCAGLGGKETKTVDSVVTSIGATIPMIAIAAAIACEREPEAMACSKLVSEGETGALDALAVLKKWVPVIQDAIESGDEIKKRTAIQHVVEAMKFVPAVYGDMHALVQRLIRP